MVTVTVDSPLNTGTPSADLTLCSSNVTGAVSLSGFVQTLVDWEQSNDNGATWISTGDMSASHDISGLTASAWFRALVESGSCGSAYSDTIIVTIEEEGASEEEEERRQAAFDHLKRRVRQ